MNDNELAKAPREENAGFWGRATARELQKRKEAEATIRRLTELIRELVEDCTCEFRDCPIHDRARSVLGASRDPRR